MKFSHVARTPDGDRRFIHRELSGLVVADRITSYLSRIRFDIGAEWLSAKTRRILFLFLIKKRRKIQGNSNRKKIRRKTEDLYYLTQIEERDKKNYSLLCVSNACELYFYSYF